MNRRARLISLGTLLLSAAFLSLAGCSGAGTTLPSGEVTLRIYNPNPSSGVFDYTKLFLDGSALPVDKISAGATYQYTSLVTTGVSHTLTFDFVAQPTGAAITTTPQIKTFTIPTSYNNQTYTYDGPTYTAP
jgi:hypothetical protein